MSNHHPRALHTPFRYGSLHKGIERLFYFFLLLQDLDLDLLEDYALEDLDLFTNEETFSGNNDGFSSMDGDDDKTGGYGTMTVMVEKGCSSNSTGDLGW